MVRIAVISCPHRGRPHPVNVALGYALMTLAAVGVHASERPGLAGVTGLPPAASRAVDFSTDVEPLLAANCHECHGSETRKGGLRLDVREEALLGGDSGAVIAPGSAGESRLLHRVAGLDPEGIMPPKGEPLNIEQIGILRAWIEQGAEWPESAMGAGAEVRSRHWAFQSVEPVEPPGVKEAAWVRNPIDRFVLARLEREGIEPSPEADRVTLIRRLSLDLTGLPPSPADVEAFASDTSPEAYGRLVERLLGSPRFGEQWARHWLDLARYADSDGYEKDFHRPHAWRWRNWVIDSINRDQPFDEFTRDQLAGDLLPDATLEQRVATGFHRNSLLNREGGVDIEEDRTKIVKDRVNTVGTAWMALTVGCAECHSHKYDPITQREFYQLYAFFNSTDDRDIPAPLPREQGTWRRGMSALDLAKEAYVADEPDGFEAWVEEVAELPDIWVTPAVEDYELPTFGANNGANLYPQEDGSFLVTGMVENKTHYIMMLNTALRGITGIRIEAMTDEMLPRLGPGWATNGNFVLTEVLVEASPLTAVTALEAYGVGSVAADYSQEGFPVGAAIDGVTTNGGWAVDLPELPMHGVDRCAVLTLKKPIDHEGESRLKVSLVQHEGKSHTLGRVRVSYTTSEPEMLAGQAVPQRIRDIAGVPEARRTLDQRAELKRYYQATFQSDVDEFVEFTKRLAESPGVKGEVRAQVLAERDILRPTHLHVRGNFLEKGAEVEPGTPAVLPPLKTGGGEADRLALAKWLVDPGHPLTARVAVNRVWHHLFGEGLVNTPADFGTQGDTPSHPELLDWLAGEYARLGWSRKELIRRIVESATYRQASAVREALLDRDVNNRLLARQNRFRLSAENARDQFLAASGLMEAGIGGPSVGSERPRRGLYQQIKRAQIDPMLAVFDAPSTVQACPKRQRSNTPLQALTLLNGDLFMRSARELGRAAGWVAGGEMESRLCELFQRCTAREPTTEDLKDLSALWTRVRDYYREEPERAVEVVGAGEPGPRDVPEAAAWTVVARVVLNLDEVITRE